MPLLCNRNECNGIRSKVDANRHTHEKLINCSFDSALQIEYLWKTFAVYEEENINAEYIHNTVWSQWMTLMYRSHISFLFLSFLYFWAFILSMFYFYTLYSNFYRYLFHLMLHISSYLQPSFSMRLLCTSYSTENDISYVD